MRHVRQAVPQVPPTQLSDPPSQHRWPPVPFIAPSCLATLLQKCDDGHYVAADKKVTGYATSNEGLRALLLGELPQDSLAAAGGCTLPVLPMPGDPSAGWLLAMGVLYHKQPFLSLVRGGAAAASQTTSD